VSSPICEPERVHAVRVVRVGRGVRVLRRSAGRAFRRGMMARRGSCVRAALVGV
jgi:hypothetical protein